MKTLSIIIGCVIILASKGSAQSIGIRLSEAFKTITIHSDPGQPKFMYHGTDTVEGLELRCYLNFNSDNCTYYKFFLEGKYDLDTFSSPEDFLLKVDTAYNYLGDPYSGSAFGCYVLEPDTFSYCRNPSQIRVVDSSKFAVRSRYYYRKGKDCYQISSVKAIVDRFRTIDTSRRKLYYRFLADNRSISFIEIIKYKTFLSMEFVSKAVLFDMKQVSIPDFTCHIIRR